MQASLSPDLLDTPLLLHLVRRDALAEWALDHYGFLREARQPLVSIVSIGEIYAIALRLGWGERRRQRREFVEPAQINLLDANRRVCAPGRSLLRKSQYRAAEQKPTACCQPDPLLIFHL